MKRLKRLILFMLFTIVLSGCEQEYFDLSIYTDPKSLKPLVYLPVSLGDYVVNDFTNIPESGNTPVLTQQIKLDSIKYELSGSDFSSATIDSLYMVIKTTNGTPMQLQYELLFEVLDPESRKVVLHSQLLPGGTLDAAGHVTAAARDSTTFALSNPEYKIVSAAKRYTLLLTLTQPKTGTVLADELKSGKVSVKVAYRAHINFLKL
jgi:hypothetical protein